MEVIPIRVLNLHIYVYIVYVYVVVEFIILGRTSSKIS